MTEALTVLSGVLLIVVLALVGWRLRRQVDKDESL